MLNWTAWIRTVWINRIAWNRILWHRNCVLKLNWIVWNRTICVKMDLALNNLQRLICHKTQATLHDCRGNCGGLSSFTNLYMIQIICIQLSGFNSSNSNVYVRMCVFLHSANAVFWNILKQHLLLLYLKPFCLLLWKGS